MEFHEHMMISGEEPHGHSQWPEPGPHHVDGHPVAPETEQSSDVTFDEAFDVLDRQTEQLRTLRGRLEGLCEYSNERDRKMRRLEQELAAARSETERERRVAADLRHELEKQDHLLRSVRESVSELASTLDSVGSSWNETRAA